MADEVLVLEDDDGDLYTVPVEVLSQFKVPADKRSELQPEGDEVEGFMISNPGWSAPSFGGARPRPGSAGYWYNGTWYPANAPKPY